MRRGTRGVHLFADHISHMHYFLTPVSLSTGVRGAAGGFRAVVG